MSVLKRSDSGRPPTWLIVLVLSVFIIFVLGAIDTISTARALTCSQANSDCEAKGLTNIIIGAPNTAASQSKGVVNIITDTANSGASKLLINIIVIPGNAQGIVPASPLTHFR